MTDPPLRRTSLEPTESNPQIPRNRSAKHDLNWSETCSFRHSGWRGDRERVYDGLVRAGIRSSVLDDFRHCGNLAYVLESLDHPGEYRVAGSTCHHRFCTPCAQERSRAIANNIVAQLNGKPARFLTLTMRSTTEPLDALLTRLTYCFATLRRRAIWKNRVKGGVSFIEIKWNDQLQRWNVHLHAIVQGLYIKQRLLSQQWKAITTDSMIVDIRLVKDDRKVSQYVTKYASKPLSSTVIHDDDRLTEAILALKGKRLATTFGNWRGVLLTPKPDKEAWINIGTLADMIQRSSTGDSNARAILLTLNVTCAASHPRTRAPPANSASGPAASKQLTLPLELVPRWTDPA